MNPTRYRTLHVNDLRLFYREAGPPDAPAVLLLHGFPSSSRMWQPLIDRLADSYRMVAPDYPGFGHSDAPPANSFSYTFDQLAEFIERFTDELALDRYSLVVQDYGGPVGMRLAVRRPNRLNALIVQNAVCHEDGLGPLWETRRAFWSDRPRHEDALRENFFSPTATR
jgi:pimeloyl-ACP methyl ester carboxylesterase